MMGRSRKRQSTYTMVLETDSSHLAVLLVGLRAEERDLIPLGKLYFGQYKSCTAGIE